MDIKKLSTKQKQALVAMVIDRKKYAKNKPPYDQLTRKIPRLYNAYNGIFTTPEKRAWRSKLFPMLSYTAVETIRAMMIYLFFKSDIWARVKAADTTPKEKELAMQSVLDYNLKKIKARYRYYTQVLSYVLKYGNGITRTYYNFRSSEKTIRNKSEENGFNIGRNKKTEKTIIADYPDFRVCNLLRVFIDPKATTLRYPEDCRYIIENRDEDFNQIKMQQRKGFYQEIDKIKLNSTGTLGDIGVDTKFLTPDGSPETEDNRNNIQIDDYYGKIDLPEWENDERPWNIVVANESDLINLDVPYDHGTLPFQIHRLIPQENRLYAMGILETILADQATYNAIVNQRLDNINIMLNQGFVMNEDAMRNPNEAIEWQPGLIIRTNGSADLNNSFKQLDIQDVTGNTFQQMTNFVERDVQKTTGATDYQQGLIQGPINQTATGISSLMESANRRFSGMAFNLSEGFDEWINSILKLNQQYTTRDRIIRLAGIDLSLKINPNDFEGEFELEAMDTTVMSKDVLAQLNVNFLATMTPYVQMLQQMGYDFNLPQIIEEIVYNFPGISKRKNLIKKKAQVPTPNPTTGSPPANMGGMPAQLQQAMAAAGGMTGGNV